MLKSLTHSIGVMSVLLLLGSCSATRFLKDGETFYAGADIRIHPQGDIPNQGAVKNNLEDLVAPKPNAKILWFRTSVWFYYIAGTPKKKKGIRYFIQNKLGSPPVLLKDATPEKTAQLLQGQLNNDGYFRSTVAHSVETRKKESTVIYDVTLQPPYRLRNIDYLAFDTTTVLGIDIMKERLLKTKQRYRLDRLQAEQSRIEEVAKNHGLYYFDNRYLIFEADSTIGKKGVDVALKFERGMPDKITRRYTLDEINVFPGYTLGNDTLKTTADTVKINGYNYIDNQHNFRPEIITDVINLRHDSLYRKIDQEYSLVHLMGLQTFKYVNIKFTDSKRDSSKLNVNIYMTPFLKKSIRVQVQGVSKSNNFVGPGFQFTFTNRNFLHGAELFQFKLHSAYEVQIRSQQTTPLNSFEIGAEASLAVPRFISPIRIRNNSDKFLPQTVFKVGYTFQERVEYFSLRSFNVSAGYIWRETTLKTHELYPIDISFVESGDRSARFDSLLDKNPVLKNSFQNQFILGTRYSFTINTQFTEDVEEKYRLKARKRSNFYFKGTIDVSGNALHALQRAGAKGDEGPYTLAGSPYSQYLRGDIDFRYYLLTGTLRKQNRLATRLIVGVGNAYGNSTNMPYVKQFSIGGSNSIRAFPARSIGPGTYNVRTDPRIAANNYFIDQRGDIKLEGNVEYRFGIVNALKGAVFVDAGNIWLFNDDPDITVTGADGQPEKVNPRPGAKFNKNQFLTELAVGTGFGLRYDFSFFVLRFDLAFPLRKPWLPPNERWVMDKIDFGSADWRSQNLILNVAIGYPF